MTMCLLLFARALHFAAGMVLGGVVAFRWLYLLPAFAGEGDEAWEKFAPFFRRMNGLFVASGVVLVLSGIGLFWAVAAGMSDKSLEESLNCDTLGAVFFQTQFGTVFQWRIGLAVVMALLMAWLVRTRWLFRRRCSVVEIAAGVVAAALTTSVAWTGHAAASGGAGWRLHLAADAVHLFVTAIWPTGLLPLVLFLTCARRAEGVVAPVRRVVRRFSQASLAVVQVLVATGVVNSCFMLGRVSALFTTTYGAVLGVKLLLVGAMLGIAAVNRFRMVPRIAGTGGLAHEDGYVGCELTRLQRLVMIELVLAVLVVVVVSVLGTTAPPQGS